MSTGNLALSLVFVHGFQGDHTSFQAFPTDLHFRLHERIPRLETYVYPTYKSRRPIESATQDFVKWMKILPEGPVILLGHSMGGILIAEAAFDPEAKDRIIGLIAFDVPFLGIHPHVVVSGLASLFKHDENKENERDVNDRNHVKMGHDAGHEQHSHSPNLQPSSASVSTSAASMSTLDRPPSLHLAVNEKVSHPVPPALSTAFQLLNLGEPSESLGNTLHWLTKHRANPFTALRDRIMETFEFGSCLLDPIGLTKRYQKLLLWGEEDGKNWVNYWTETVPKHPSKEVEERKKAFPEIKVDKMGEGGGVGDESDDDGYETADEGDIERQHEETSGLANLLGGKSQSASVAGDSMVSLASATSETPAAPHAESEEDTSPPPARVDALQPEGQSETHPSKEEPSGQPPPEDSMEVQLRKEKELEESFAAHEQAEEHLKGKQSEEEAAKEGQAAEGLSKEEQAERAKAAKEAEQARKQAEKEAKQAAKEREAAEKRAQKEREKKEKAEKKEREAAEKAAKKELEAAEKAAKKARDRALADEKKRNTPEIPRHFIVLPISGGKKQWVRVPVAGVEDEVQGHCGLFFRKENWEYDSFVDDVGELVFGWWSQSKGRLVA